MSIIRHLQNATAVKVETKKNEFGEKVHAGSGVEYPCRFRVTPGDNIVQGANRETITADAQAWFEPEAVIAEGDIWYIFGENWRTKTVQEARGAGSAVEFLKVFLDRYEQGAA